MRCKLATLSWHFCCRGIKKRTTRRRAAANDESVHQLLNNIFLQRRSQIKQAAYHAHHDAIPTFYQAHKLTRYGASSGNWQPSFEKSRLNKSIQFRSKK